MLAFSFLRYNQHYQAYLDCMVQQLVIQLQAGHHYHHEFWNVYVI